MICLIGFLLVWHPKKIWTFEDETSKSAHADHGYSRADISRAWVPWIILSVIVFTWGTQTGKLWMNSQKRFCLHRQLECKASRITNPQFPSSD